MPHDDDKSLGDEATLQGGKLAPADERSLGDRSTFGGGDGSSLSDPGIVYERVRSLVSPYAYLSESDPVSKKLPCNLSYSVLVSGIILLQCNCLNLG